MKIFVEELLMAKVSQLYQVEFGRIITTTYSFRQPLGLSWYNKELVHMLEPFMLMIQAW